MPDWPNCLTEVETLAKMGEGMSISRLGDGEFGIARGGGNSTHAKNKVLASELRAILSNPIDSCISAIPTMDSKSPKYAYGPDRQMGWHKHIKRYMSLLDPNHTYGSAFVGQVASAPWILDDTNYGEGFRKIWRGKRVIGITPYLDRNLQKALSVDAGEVIIIQCTKTEAYKQIEIIQKECVLVKPDVVVICAGPMASCLATRLAKKGIQAIDLGRGLGVVFRSAIGAKPPNERKMPDA